MQPIVPMGMSEHGERLTLEWMSTTNDSDLLGIVMGVGSVWRFPSTRSHTTSCWAK
jgi:hypothetical protein